MFDDVAVLLEGLFVFVLGMLWEEFVLEFVFCVCGGVGVFVRSRVVGVWLVRLFLVGVGVLNAKERGVG